MSRLVKVTVMRGGPSAEREVSLRSGAAVVQALRARGHTVDEVDPQGAGWWLPAGTEVVFLALHGTYGEDGTVQRELDAQGVPYTGCDAESSRVAFDKVLSKQRFLAQGVPTARYAVLGRAAAGWPAGWRPPVVLKPARQGSSVGLQFVDESSALAAGLTAALIHDSEVVMEERVFGREVTVAILEERTLPIVEIRPRAGAYDYTNKYTPGRTDYLVPAEFPGGVRDGVERAAREAFRAVGGRDYGRVDLMVRDDGAPFVLEVNTLPGMTETSLFPKAAAAAGMGFGDLCERMLELALGHPQPARATV